MDLEGLIFSELSEFDQRTQDYMMGGGALCGSEQEGRVACFIIQLQLSIKRGFFEHAIVLKLHFYFLTWKCLCYVSDL